MTPDQARELLIQVKCEQSDHVGWREALHVLSGLRYEYAYQVKLPGDESWVWIAANGQYTHSESAAQWDEDPEQTDLAASFETHPTRIFRRLVGAPELA